MTWNGQGELPWATTGSTVGTVGLTLVSPDGSSRPSGGFATGDSTGGSFAGDGEKGTWTLLVDLDGASTGTVSLRLG